MTPRFSVLLPTHNRADVIGYAIQSVLRQSEQDFEVLIVGDGCTDKTAEVVAAFDDPRLQWFDLPKAPYYGYANRNIALKQARGDYIAFMAHDDILFPDHLEILAATLESTRKEWAYSRPLWVDLNGNIAAYPMNLENDRELDVFLNHRNTVPASCVVHRRDCFEKYGYWPEDVPRSADWHFWRRILEGGGRENFAQCPKPTCLHFVADWRRKRAPAYDSPDQAIVGSVRIPPGHTEQQAFFDAMVAGGDEWVSAIRQATCRAVDGLAWRATTELAPRLAAASKSAEGTARRLSGLEREKRALEADKVELKKVAARLRREVEALRESNSWRITSPLRRLKRLLRRGD
ncbi:glycosyltransferase [Methyloceanibacter sp. wino2]|uniref:glycosyltransferase n=1 Tax=Methyloceanibacter sp. wino2 TaxID=2170729 RepID=UPI00131F3EA4|nr:glycosyltransferase [Methyloceanibacter sp. wino2]